MCHILETLSDPRWHFGLSLSGISLKAIRIIDRQSLCHLQLLTLFILTVCLPDFCTEHHYRCFTVCPAQWFTTGDSVTPRCLLKMFGHVFCVCCSAWGKAIDI